MTDVIYGRHPVLEALKAGEPITEVHVAEGSKSHGAMGMLLRAAAERGVPVKHVPRAALDRAVGAAGTGSGNHQGVVALAEGFRYADPAEVVAVALRRDEPPFVVVLDQVQDVHNLGSLVRTAAAVGAHGVLIPERKSAGVTPAVRKASAGAVTHVAIARSDLVPALDMLRARGIRVVGLDARAEQVYTQVDLTGPLAVVVGGESHGLRPSITSRCDSLVRLPMFGAMDSLNAAVAGSVVLYEALRQRS